MKILTWNILASEWIKKSYYPTVKDHSLFQSDTRCKIILDKLKDESADIVFLQEVMPLEYKILYQEFHRMYQFSTLSNIQWYNLKKSDSGNLTMVKKHLFNSWNETPFDHGLYVKIDNLHLFNVHLDDVSYDKRKKQLRQLPLDHKYVILAGDFNQNYKKESKLYDLPGFSVHNKCNTYFVEKKMNIDNILSKGFIHHNDSCEYVPSKVEEGLNLYGSDHIPVTVKLSYSKSKSKI
jgi:endonuclease/exonuclease/phosphatase family metal-dependent hydrolase